ncbi:hypothetical protein D3C86_2072230 [compost metagenome]
MDYRLTERFNPFYFMMVKRRFNKIFITFAIGLQVSIQYSMGCVEECYRIMLSYFKSDDFFLMHRNDLVIAEQGLKS